jgi:preprotein translocase SecE subunit
VAQKRQRSKQRQAERRQRRLAERGGAGSLTDGDEATRQRDPERQEAEENVDLEVAAPPEEVGRSDFTTRHEQPPPPDFEIDDEELADEAEAGAAPAAGGRGPRGVRGGDGAGAAAAGEPLPKERGRIIEFLKAVWAELQRVQWPDRRQTTQLTGVVLFFVLILGAYLGGLDAIFSKLIQSIL